MAEKRKRGRPVEVVETVFEATRHMLTENAPRAVSFEMVASYSGVHLTTLYRRWGNLDNLLCAVLEWMSAEVIPIPDSGSLQGDLRELIELYADHFNGSTGRAINRLLIDYAHTEEGDRAQWVRNHLEYQTEQFSIVVQRAVDRGEKVSLEDFLFAMGLALGFFLMQSLLIDETIDRVLVEKLCGIAGDYLQVSPSS